MRITDNMAFEQVRSNLSKNRSEMSQLQNQAATQKRVTKPSDDPVAASRVLSSRIDLQGNKQFVKNLNYAKSFLEYTDQSLDELTEHLVRIKELLVGQANDASSNKQSRRVVATEIEQLYNQVVQIGNRKLGDRYIFSGYKTTQAPFDYRGEYVGDAGEMMIGVDKSSFIAMNLPGSKIFMGEGLSADGASHRTPKQATTIEELLAQQEKEKPKPQQPGQVPQGNSPQSSVEVRGPASTLAPENSIPNQQPQPKEVKGINLFDLIRRIEIGLKTDDKMVIQNSLEKVDDAISQVVLGRSQVGSRSMVLANALDSLHKSGVDSQILISELEDADVFKVVSDINKTESTLKAALSTSGKVIQPSLLDFLR